ncbi:MAG: flavin reductase family protein [Bacteroidales bacterium]|nr:flavin reductase family protein [Bacteroidales bacterium]
MPKEKIPLGAFPFIYPMPTVILGSEVDGKPAFITVSFIGIVQQSPPMVSVSLVNNHLTNKGIKQNQTFSINIPHTKMLAKTDFVGMNSGAIINKSSLFEVFYGKLENAPMIKEAPLNLECKLVEVLHPGDQTELFIGEIIQTYSSKKYLNKGYPDIRKLDPILFSITSKDYYKTGRKIGAAWKTGLRISSSRYRNK